MDPAGAPPVRLAIDGEGVAPGLPGTADVPVLNTLLPAAVASGEPATPDGAAIDDALAPGGVTAGVAAGAPVELIPGSPEVPVSNTDVPPMPVGEGVGTEDPRTPGPPPGVPIPGVSAAGLNAEAPGAARKSAAVPNTEAGRAACKISQAQS